MRAVAGIPDLIRSRRTHKSFGPDPVPPTVVDELLELARWAPNHHRTNPWRFRILGPETLERLTPVVEKVMSEGPGGPPPAREYTYELHDVVKG